MPDTDRRAIVVVLGTRPEAIKLAPVILRLRQHPRLTCRVCCTGQHREMLDHILESFGVVPDDDLRLMQPGDTLGTLTARMIQSLDGYLTTHHPDLLLVQGDTTTTLCASLAAFYNRIPIAHVEAGLRTGDLSAPWPEEANRSLTARLAALHFAPTAGNRAALIREGIPAERIYVTGNTIVDALYYALAVVRGRPIQVPGLPADALEAWPDIILITGHRRENFGPGLRGICTAIARLALRFPNIHFVYPVHLNPKVKEQVAETLSTEMCPNVHLISPVPYLPFVALMDRAELILTDSGGIQEEAPSLGKAVFVLRNLTERREGLSRGGRARLVGTEPTRIVAAVTRELGRRRCCRDSSQAETPYGDGRAAERIVDIIAATSDLTFGGKMGSLRA